jgi:hypothetical protein
MAGSNLTVSEDMKDDSLQDSVPIHNRIQTHKVTKEDMVEYLLNPRGPGHIPAHMRSKIRRDNESRNKHPKMSCSEAAMKLLELEESMAEKGVLPEEIGKISKAAGSSGLFPPIHIIKKKTEIKAQAALAEKVSTRRNELWELLEHAQDAAKHFRSKGDEVAAGKIKSAGQMASSASGLKRHSQKESQKARANPIVNGHQLGAVEGASTSGKGSGRLREVKKYISAKSAALTTRDTVSSREADREGSDTQGDSKFSPFDEDSMMSEMEFRLRKKSMLYSLPEGPRLTVTKVGDQVIVKNSLDKSKYSLDPNSAGEANDLNKMTGEAMMAKFKDQLLKRTFQSLNELTSEINGEPVPASGTALTELIDKEMSNITVTSIDSDSANSPSRGGKKGKKRDASYAANHPTAGAPSRKLEVLGATKWRVLEQQSSGKGASLLTLPEADEARYLAHYREQEVMKERAKEEVIKALSFANPLLKISQKGHHHRGNSSIDEGDEDDLGSPDAEKTAAKKVSKSFYG